MTGAYLFDENKNPTEVEFLSSERRKELFMSRDREEVLRWLDLVCEHLVVAEKLLIENKIILKDG